MVPNSEMATFSSELKLRFSIVLWDCGRKHNRGVSMEYHSGSEWDEADLFFLADTLRRGMPIDRVAGFLNRSAAEVRLKARDLKVAIADDLGRRKTA